MNDKELYYVVEWRQDYDGNVSKRYLHRDHRQRWKDTHKGAMCFKKDGAESIVRDHDKEWRCYEFNCDIELVIKQEPEDIFRIGGLAAKPTNDFCSVKYDYIASFIVDLRHEPDDNIMERGFVSVSGVYDNDHYYSECLSNADLGTFLSSDEREELPDGVYRLVYEVNACGEKYWTDCGYEYDAWEEYELISRVELLEDEYMYLLQAEQEEINDFYSPFDGINTIGEAM